MRLCLCTNAVRTSAHSARTRSHARADGVVDAKAVQALADELDDDGVADIASTPMGSTADTSAAFKAWAAESHAFARNTSYAAALLADLGDGREAHTKAAYWADYAADASAVARDRLRLGGARLSQVLNSLHTAAAADAAAVLVPASAVLGVAASAAGAAASA